MKVELIFTLVLLCAVLPIKGQETCQSKMLVDSDGNWNGEKIAPKYADYIDQTKDVGHTIAYNGVHSCYTLQPGPIPGTSKNYLTCCYIEYKFKLKSNSDKYTSRACIPIKSEEINGDFESFVDGMDDKIYGKMTDAVVDEVSDVSIVCSKSSFLKVSALLLLAFLL